MNRNEIDSLKSRGQISVLDYPYWSTIVPTTQGTLPFFTTSGAISAINGIDSPQQLDKTALFVMQMLQITVQSDDGVPLVIADLTTVGRLIRSAWLNFTINGGQRVGRWAMSSFLTFPGQVTTSGGYDLSKSVSGCVKLNTPADIAGGATVEASLNWPATVDLSGIEVNLKLYGLTYRQLAN
jgi:hypothetical protein